MFLLSDLFRQYLIVFLAVSFAALGLLFAYVLIRHGVENLREQRALRLRTLYQPDVDAVLASQSPAELEAAIARLAAAPPRHVADIGALLIAGAMIHTRAPAKSR